ncbi:MAG: GntR family transcriptional regulator [Micromonosporaceae bacterium]|nr:GntR family transcriptional regulator [Micromonosporaceae bacterium]
MDPRPRPRDRTTSAATSVTHGLPWSHQRAAGILASRMPPPPITIDKAGALLASPEPVTETSAPYLRIAADLRAAITCGALKPGDPLPTHAELMERYDVAAGTAHRAVAELTRTGEITVSRGIRATVTTP